MSLLGSIASIGGMVIGGIIGGLISGGNPAGIIAGASIGGALGGLSGSLLFPEQMDLNLPPPPQPRESRLQISTYGEAIPVVYSAARLAGNIIYMQDVQETVVRSRHRNDGVRYYDMVKTYTATFAVAFCEGPIVGIARIWVNGKIFVDFRDPDGPYYPTGSVGLATGNLDTSIARAEAKFSIHLGAEDQAFDPSIAAILTADETPAYRGTFYIVFIDFPVGEYSGLPTIEVEIAEEQEIARIDVSATGSSAADDGWIWYLHNDTLKRTDYVTCGYEASGDNKAFFRFNNVEVPKGAVLTEVHLHLSVRGAPALPLEARIKVEQSVNPTAIANKGDYNSRDWGTEYVTWTFSSAGDGAQSPDIKSLIQPIIDDASWASGNSIQVTVCPVLTSGTPSKYMEWYGWGDGFDDPRITLSSGYY